MYSWLWKRSYWSHTYQLCHIELIWPYIARLQWERGKIIHSDIATFHLIFIHWYCLSSSDFLVLCGLNIFICVQSHNLLLKSRQLLAVLFLLVHVCRPPSPIRCGLCLYALWTITSFIVWIFYLMFV